MNTKVNPSDKACKFFFDNDRRFASLFNATLFHGDDIIKEEQLSSFSGEETTILSKEGQDILGIERLRDAIKKAGDEGYYSLLGLESQKTVDYSMALRVPIYDLLNYYNQYKNLSLKQVKKLLPVFTLVLYVGEKRWTAAKSLKEMMIGIPENMKELFNDWKLLFVDIKELDASLIKDEETKEMIKAIQEIYQAKKGKRIEDITLSQDAAITAGMITNSKWLIEEAYKKEEVNMCEAMERYTREVKEEGFSEGMELGKEEGLKEGKEEGTKQTVLQLLTKKLGNISNQMIERIEGSPSQKIDLLVISIFDIEDEQDILNIIH